MGAADHGPIGNSPTAPDRGNKLALGDDTIAVLQEVNQYVEHLRLEVDAFPAAQQFAPVGIECVIRK